MVASVSMNALPKVLVVDDGQRVGLDLLSAELAELGLSSVTTSLEAADEVLDLIERPAAIFLRLPGTKQDSSYQMFVRLAHQLRTAERTLGIPVIMWDRTAALDRGGISAILRTEVGPQALSGPEL